MNPKSLLLNLAATVGLLGCAPAMMASPQNQTATLTSEPDNPMAIATTLAPTEYKATPGTKLERAMFAGGCFWGTEYYFRHTPGVIATAVGFSGGTAKNPTYKQVCYENTGHAETVLVEFDPAQISYKKLIQRFWDIHNPCSMNRQGPDVGDQYRSEIFFLTPEQKTIAEQAKKDAQAMFTEPIVTKIEKAGPFYFAENYHQQYAEKTGHVSCPIDTSTRKKGG